MRWIALLLLLCPSLASQEQGVQVEGVAIDSVTRQPMAGVHIRMWSLAEDLFNPDDHMDTWGAITRADGHFSITGLKPDLYAIEGESNGYLCLPGKTADGRSNNSVMLKAGEATNGVVVEMTRYAVISGRVLDEYGDPKQMATVSVEPAVSESRESPSYGGTDDRGEFRIPVQPGKFRVQANPFGETRYQATYYPATSDKGKASVVEVAAGQLVAGLDIRLSPLRINPGSIKGTVTGIPADRGKSFLQVMLLSERPDFGKGNGVFFGRRGVPVMPDGTFHLTGLEEGRYRVMAALETREGTALMRSLPVDLPPGGSGETALTLSLQEGEVVTGTLEIAGTPAKLMAGEKPTVLLESQTMMLPGMRTTAEVDANGTFRLSGVFPDRYNVTLASLPEDAFLRSIKLGDADAPKGVIDLSRGAGGAFLKIAISRDGGLVEGSALGPDGQPFSAAGVVLASSTTEYHGPQRVRAGEKFRFNALAPGKYRLLAVGIQDSPGGYPDIDADFSDAPEIEVHEGDHITKDVTVKPRGHKAAEGSDAKR